MDRRLRAADRAPDGDALFRLEGEYWTIAYQGRVLRLRDSKGLRYLGHLLCQPGRFFQAEELPPAIGVRSEEPVPDAEMVRVAVTKRIKATIAKIGEHDRGLGYHLSTTIRTGYACVYLPDPERPIAWRE